ncbi:MAG: response regulator transcription factor [Pseudomonadota bacterium]
MSNPHILIIDDDEALGAMLEEFLAPDQLDVSICLSAEAGLDHLRQQNVDLIILDLMLPGMNGLDALKQIRQTDDTPIIMLTARGEDVDRILGLEFGADDYLAKPFNPRELLARIRAILRRSQTAATTDQRLSVAALTLDARSRSVNAGTTNVHLTGTEFELLFCLARSPGSVVSKEQLSQQVLGRQHMPYDRSIDTHISNVRRKLGKAGVTNPSLQSQRGVGYVLLVTGEH